jgi:hypothetical protein
LKTFLTQIGPTLPLTPDPPVIYFWKWIGWKDYEVPIAIWRAFLPKTNCFLTHLTHTHLCILASGPHLTRMLYRWRLESQCVCRFIQSYTSPSRRATPTSPIRCRRRWLLTTERPDDEKEDEEDH